MPLGSYTRCRNSVSPWSQPILKFLVIGQTNTLFTRRILRPPPQQLNRRGGIKALEYVTVYNKGIIPVGLKCGLQELFVKTYTTN